MIIKILFLLLIIEEFVSVVKTEKYYEDLSISNLNDGSIYSLFQFTTVIEKNIFEEKISEHYNLFPKSFGEIISKFQLAELHLSFTQGRWRYNKWGYPALSAPTGVELWAWFLPEMDEVRVQKNWKGLVHALSGQFCSSLNFITTSETTRPELSFRPLGVWPNGTVNASNIHLRYAMLSKETVCTENLSPWKKLLPCLGKAGFSTLLNSFRLFDSSYISIAIHVSSKCTLEDCSDISLELKQTVSSVVDPVRYSLEKGWSFESLYGSILFSTCPLASSNSIMVNNQPNNVKGFNLSPVSEDTLEVNGKEFIVYHLHQINSSFDVTAKYNLARKYSDENYVIAHKYITGYGQERVGSICNIKNNHPFDTLTIVYMDVLPYFVRTYFHTLKVHVADKEIQPDEIKFTPCYYRQRPATLELKLTIPAQKTVSISIEFEKVFLDWTEHPPDSHHGYYIGSSVISGFVKSDSNSIPLNEQCSTPQRNIACPSIIASQTIFRRIYTEPLLIQVPLPDFSMPYNVICLTCTIIAIVFGSIYSVTTRTFQVENENEKKTLKQRFMDFISRLKQSKEKNE